MDAQAPLRCRVPRDGADPDALLEAFLGYVEDRKLSLYSAQEEAILELFSGSNVILNTPTGSGKSLVAEAAHFRALARKEVSFYTAPIKALVSEKFFALCRAFGADVVGMLTGDATVNRDAPIICCTAEILANLALREGEHADVQHVVMDEFHYYSDRDRGAAWQIPLLTLPQSRFLLMSATLGDTQKFETTLNELTGASTALVKSAQRPVPLDFEYRLTPLHETIADLLESARVPVYIVHFSQRAATEQAQNLMSVDFLSKEQKNAIKAELRGFRFDTPFGRELSRFVRHGVGVHHAGLLPKYRLMVEKLAQQGHLKLICGTDTLGVGVNIPIRSVLFTQLCKFDGDKTGVLTVRDFKQIAGRAGRKGYDDRGTVVVQAPEHVIENRTMEGKAAGDAKKLRKMVRKKPPERGYAHWDENTFTRLQTSEPEPLSSSFQVSHAMLLHMFERPGDGCRALKDLIRSSHEGPKATRRHGRNAIALFRSLLQAEIVQMHKEPDAHGRRVELNQHLQEDFSLNQALSLWAIDTLPLLDDESETYAHDVLTLVEAVQESPKVLLLRQLDKIKTDLIAQWKADGVEYDERMARLEKIEHYKPLRELIYESFNEFVEKQPWVGENIRPKSIARDMYERAATFRDYVKEYGLQRSEGVLLRYLSDVYKATVQTVPEDAKTDSVYEITDWLGAVVRQVDSSLIDEWEKLREPDPDAAPTEEPSAPTEYDVTASEKDFRVLVRNALFRIVRHVARRDYGAVAEALSRAEGEPLWTVERVGALFEDYWSNHEEVRIDAAARGPQWVRIRAGDPAWQASQTLLDPQDHGEWHMDFTIDLEASRAEQRPVLWLRGVGTD